MLPCLLMAINRRLMVLPNSYSLVVVGDLLTGAEIDKLPVPFLHNRPHTALGLRLVLRAECLHKFLFADHLGESERNAHSHIVACAAPKDVA